MSTKFNNFYGSPPALTTTHSQQVTSIPDQYQLLSF